MSRARNTMVSERTPSASQVTICWKITNIKCNIFEKNTMTNSNDRIDRIEILLERFMDASLAETRASDERLTRIEQLVASNSRSIQALTDDLAEFKFTMTEEREQVAEERAELRRATIGIANLLSSLDEDRPTILRRLSGIENKVDRLLERKNGDESLS